MDNDIENIFKTQSKVIPLKVREFIVSGNWEISLDDIIERYKLPPKNANSLSTDTMLVLTGLIHPDDFHEEIKGRMGGDATTADSITNEIEEKIFAPIRVDLVKFFEEQEAEEKEFEKKEAEQVSVQTPAKTWEKMPDIAPDNLPTGENEDEKLKMKKEKSEEGEISPIPALIPKTRPGGDEQNEKQEETHPFEEKMKKVFTGASTTIGDLAIETPTPEKDISVVSDPYREPIE